ncbi:MAG TPA: hypothetical protein VFV01_13495 [Spirillospora sp.]|nr:hypothetical protein [Spirillospora sp.]
MPGDPARYADGQNMGWRLSSFNDSDEQLSDTLLVGREQFIRVRDLFDFGDDEWFADSYPVTAERWPKLIEVLGCPPREPGKSYFLEGYATDL